MLGDSLPRGVGGSCIEAVEEVDVSREGLSSLLELSGESGRERFLGGGDGGFDRIMTS